MNSLSSYTHVLRKRKDALVSVQSISSELLERLVSGDLDNLQEILDRREKACCLLAKSMDGSPELPSILEQARKAAAQNNETVDSILGLDDDIRAILTDVIEKQKKCEELLKADISKIAEELRQSSNRRHLNSAYGPANARPQARFIDRKR